MKKTLIPVIALLIGITSCQKDEFVEIIKSETSNETLQLTSDGEIIDTEISNVKKSGISESVGANEIDLWEKEEIQISIKEVSDGDDEADDGDDSKTD